MSNSIRVMHLLSSDRFSGAENVVCQICALAGGAPDLEMVYCSPDGAIREAVGERGITFFPLSSMSVGGVRRAIRELSPDVIHAHDMRASFYAALACRGIPLISHIHNNAFGSRALSPRSIAYLYAAKRARRIFWVSESAMEGYAFRSAVKGKSEVLRNVLDTAELYVRADADPRQYGYDAVYLGRLTYPKDPERLIRVLSLMKERKGDLRAAIVGTGDLEGRVRELIGETGLAENVEMLGFVENPLKILRDSRVMLMTSRWEGTPMCLLEAIALGVPTVGTPVDGLRELIKDGENGYLSDDDARLADRALALIEDGELRATFSARLLKLSGEINDTGSYVRTLREAYFGKNV